MRRTSIVAAVTAMLILAMTTAFAASASAQAPPSNDARDTPVVLGALPASVSGTTAGATIAPTDPPASCADEGGSVWYQLTIGKQAPPKLAVQLEANGELDAVVDVFVKERSQSIPVTCQRTDKNGEAVFAFTPQKSTTYLIRVAQLFNSDSGTFTLNVFQPPPAAAPPGAPLGPLGASGSLARVVDVSSAYSAKLTAGVSYQVNLVSRIKGCMRLAIFGPGTKSFDSASPVGGLSCQGYRLFTPRLSGRYSLLVQADGFAPGAQHYHLQLAAATAAQTAPGLPLGNYRRVGGFLSGSHVGVVRLYRFDVTTRSDLQLNLSTGAQRPFNLELLSQGGKQLDCSCDAEGNQTLTFTTRPGRYYALVQARDFSSGGFTLIRRSRTITHTTVLIDGARYIQRPPGATASIQVHVSPGVSGPATIEIDRFDPVAGWQFFKNERVNIADGRGSVSFTPPSTGQWLAHADFLGSRGASPSESGYSRLLSAGPLNDQLAGGVS
jgi:hypothetical protein